MDLITSWLFNGDINERLIEQLNKKNAENKQITEHNQHMYELFSEANNKIKIRKTQLDKINTENQSLVKQLNDKDKMLTEQLNVNKHLAKLLDEKNTENQNLVKQLNDKNDLNEKLVGQLNDIQISVVKQLNEHIHSLAKQLDYYKTLAKQNDDQKQLLRKYLSETNDKVIFLEKQSIHPFSNSHKFSHANTKYRCNYLCLWFDDAGVYQLYDTPTQTYIMENYAKKNNAFSLKMGQFDYDIDLTAKVQINKQTGKRRNMLVGIQSLNDLKGIPFPSLQPLISQKVIYEISNLITDSDDVILKKNTSTDLHHLLDYWLCTYGLPNGKLSDHKLNFSLDNVQMITNMHLTEQFLIRCTKNTTATIVLHGTDKKNIDSICHDGFKRRYEQKQLYGPGFYGSDSSKYSINYSTVYNVNKYDLFLCLCINGSETKTEFHDGCNMTICENYADVLPIALVTLSKN